MSGIGAHPFLGVTGQPSGRDQMNADMSYGAEMARVRKEERSSYKRVWFFVFCIFLFVSAFARFLPRAWRPSEFGQNGRSVFADARVAADQTVPYIFMA
jgi:hypothetical protein